MKKTIITSTLAIASMVATSHAAVIDLGSGTNNNVGGLTNVVDGDNLDFGAAGLNFGSTGSSSTVFTVQEGGNSVTLRMNFDVVGTVSPNKNVGGIEAGESITVSFDLVSGGLDSFSISNFGERNTTATTLGVAAEGFRYSDGSGNSNTWYALDTVNRNVNSTGTFYVSSDSSYNLGTLNPVSQNTVAGLDVLTKDNLATWSFKIEGIDNAGSLADVALNQLVLNVGVSAVPEPSSAALLGLGGLALILRRRK